MRKPVAHCVPTDSWFSADVGSDVEKRCFFLETDHFEVFFFFCE